MKRITRLLFCMLIGIGTSGLGVSSAELAKPPTQNAVKKSKDLSTQLAQAVALLDGYRGDGGDLEAAREMLDAILRKDPRYAPAHREYVRYFIMSGHTSYLNFQPGSLEAAEKSLNKALEINPNYAEAYVLAGHLYRMMRRPAEAKAALTKADALGTPDPWLQNNWADLLMDEGKYDEAMQRYNKVLDSGTPNKKAMGVAFEGLTSYYQKTGRLDDADATYKKSLAYEPGAWSHGNYAWFLLCSRDDYEAALPQIRQALKIMDYGVGEQTLVAVLHRKWAAQVLKGESGDAEMAEARAISPVSPLQSVVSFCGQGQAANAVQKAVMQQTNKLSY
jgi:Tfp pilus assembly protein PilF